jgi:hypothetical protein
MERLDPESRVAPWADDYADTVAIQCGYAAMRLFRRNQSRRSQLTRALTSFPTASK